MKAFRFSWLPLVLSFESLSLSQAQGFGFVKQLKKKKKKRNKKLPIMNLVLVVNTMNWHKIENAIMWCTIFIYPI